MSVHIPPDETGPVVMVDDSPDDILIARRCHRKSGLPNAFLPLNGGLELLAHLEDVDAGRAPMPAVVLLDINMPDLNGFETLARVRGHAAFVEVPVIMMLTNSDDPRDVKRAIESGASGLQIKPTRVRDYVAFFDSLTAA